MQTQTISDFLTDTFARNRALYGGYVMELEEGADKEAEQDADKKADESAEPAEKKADEPADKDAEKADEGESDEEKADKGLSHEDALKALAKVRGENASWRTKHRELEAKLTDAKTPEQVEEILAGLKTEREADDKKLADLMVENVALKFKLPDDLAAALKGSTREELEAHAKVLAKYAPVDDEIEPDAENLQGGLRPGNEDGPFDAKAELAKIRHRRR